MLAQNVRIILIQCGAIEPNFSACGLPNTRQCARQRRFPGTRCADDADRLTGFNRKADSAQCCLLATWRQHRDLIRYQSRGWFW